MVSLAPELLRRLHIHADAEKAKWLKNYVKHDTQSIGVGIPLIRIIVKEIVENSPLAKVDIQDSIDFTNALMSSQYTESKLAAILYIQLYQQNAEASELLNLADQWFSNRWISDWNVCDWMCVRLLTPLFDSNPVACLRQFAEWNTSNYLWTARASIVPLAQATTLPQYLDDVQNLSQNLIVRKERFCKTAVGWVLREVSKFDSEFVLTFLDNHKLHITPDVRRNSTKYLRRRSAAK